MTIASDAPAVYLVDDEAVVRDALEFLFTSHGLVVHAFDGGPALLARLATGVPVRGCIVMDVRMEPLSGLQVHDEMVRRSVLVPVIFLTGHGDIPMAVDALKKGAFDFVEKPAGDAALVERVRDAMRADADAQQRLAAGDSRGARLAALTQREHDVMQRVAAGKLNKVIADEMHVSVRTVEVYRARVYAKLGVRSAAEVATLLARA